MRRWAVAAGYHLGIFTITCVGVALGNSMGNLGLVKGFIIFFLIHILTFKLIPIYRLLQERLIPTFRCPACGYQIDLVQHWKCSCGFVPGHPQHVFSRCRNCGKNFAWIPCPNCGAGILV